MSSTSFKQSMRRLWALDKFSYSVRVFIALTGSMTLCWYQDEMTLLIPLFLGIIASALAETDDSWQGRLNALAVTLVCFSIAALSVELLFPYPWAFAVALALASFGLTMLGALGERYGAIASATLILSVYTMIGVDQRGGAVTDFWHEPLLLVAGAAWYGVLSVLWQVLFSNQSGAAEPGAVVSRVGALPQAQIVAVRADPPVERGGAPPGAGPAKRPGGGRAERGEGNHPAPRRQWPAGLQGQSLPSSCISWPRTSTNAPARPTIPTTPWPRPSSTAMCCSAASACCASKGKACEALAESIQLRQPFIYDASFAEALGDLNASMEHLRIQSNPAWRGLLRSLRALAANLSTPRPPCWATRATRTPWPMPATATCLTVPHATSRKCGHAYAPSSRRLRCCSATLCAWPWR
jgi:hypothetical protein